MKRYALKYVSGPHKGKWQGSMGPWHRSSTSPKLYTKKGMAEKYCVFEQEVVTFHLVEEDQLPIKVAIIESERGWGAKVDQIRKFATVGEADAFVKEYNSGNTGESAPDWYMYAERMGGR